MGWFLKALWISVSSVLLLAGIALVNGLLTKPEILPDLPPTTWTVDVERAASNLSRAIQFETVSGQPDEAFTGFRQWLATAYPQVHANLSLELLGDHTLLFTWVGEDEQAPVLLTGHYDVVPVKEQALKSWTHPPFSGEVADGFIWGRGALDNKGAVIAILEAVESLLLAGFQPQRTIYLSFGHDEETGGKAGAGNVVAHLQRNGVLPAWSLDEGSYLMQGVFPGLDQPVASINVAEKGYVTLSITATGTPGHSSTPPRKTAVGHLAEAIVSIQDNPMPGGLNGVPADMFETLAPYLPLKQRLMMANLWLFRPLLEAQLSRSPATDALLRTTTAPTMLSGSIKENVLPAEATALINFRIHPADTADSVISHIKALVNADHIEIGIVNDRVTPPSPIASHEAAGYSAITQALRRTYGDIVVVPGMTGAATDSKHYSKLVEDAYRINPFLLSPGEAGGIHGNNERLSLMNLENGILSYIHLIESL
jgi:carboxypeptidase PM20D1